MCTLITDPEPQAHPSLQLDTSHICILSLSIRQGCVTKWWECHMLMCHAARSAGASACGAHRRMCTAELSDALMQ